MDRLMSVLAAVLPIFAMIGAGYGFGRLRGVGAEGVALLNAFVVWLALPALLFQTMAEARWQDMWHPGFIGASGGGALMTFLAMLVWRVRGGRRSLARRSLDALAAGYANTAYMGIPLCHMLLGAAAVQAAVIATILTVCLLFALAVILIEFDLDRGGGLGVTVRRVGISLFRNPLILSPLVGAIWAGVGLGVPAPLHSFTSLLGSAATPTALVTIGAFLALPQPGGGGRALAPVVGLKLIFQPAVTAVLALWVFRMPPMWSTAAILIAALPTGTGSFMVAQLYRQEVGLSSRAVLFSTVLSTLSVSLLAIILLP